jgi:hypothetical protein
MALRPVGLQPPAQPLRLTPSAQLPATMFLVEADNPGMTTVCLTWFEETASLFPSTFTKPNQRPITAVFAVPARGPALRTARLARPRFSATVRRDQVHP